MNTLTLAQTVELISTMKNALPYIPRDNATFRDNHRNIFIPALSLGDKKFVNKLVDMLDSMPEESSIDLVIMSPNYDENNEYISKHSHHVMYEINCKHDINIYDKMVNCKSYGVIDRTKEDETEYFNAYLYYNQNSMTLNKWPKSIAMILQGLINKSMAE